MRRVNQKKKREEIRLKGEEGYEGEEEEGGGFVVFFPVCW